MAKKKISPVEPSFEEIIHIEPMEQVMSSRYATYAKCVIQDRAIPDARDGLKPVQRRIIYSMYRTGNLYSRPTRKCAKVVGDVMGHYHPHGDSSIYDALVRMSQNWKLNCPLTDFQGNNGSIDGDQAAAYRYTECRLSAIAEELVADIDKETVDMSLTFDDTDYEPVVLPARFPNLLVNGTEGIAVAIATDIPTHNLREVVDAVIYRINHVHTTIDDLRQFVLGPDFPTGGLIYDGPGLKEMYETGKGRIEVVAKTEIIDDGKIKQIAITEIPYKTVKINLVHELDLIRHNKTIDGILEVRDETDRSGMRIAIDIKKDANITAIYKYLMNKTGLTTSYSANMVAIVNGRPKTMNLLDFIDCYVNHQVDVITRRSKYDLTKNQSRLDIVNGLIKAISILDEVIKVIRSSSDKKNVKENLQKTFGFNEPQSEAIAMMQLYKLSNTDITTLVNEKKTLEEKIEFLNGILNDRKKLDRLLISDLKDIAKKYGSDRKTQIVEKIDVSVNKRDLISKEDTMVAITRDGYIKRSSLKSYNSSGVNALPGLKEGDILIYKGQVSTTDYLLCFTSLGNYLYLPVHEINENKWKDEGKHVNYLSTLAPNDKIIKVYALEKFRNDLFFVLVSKNGQIKRVPISDFEVSRYSKAIVCMRLLQGDEVADVCFTNGNSNIILFSSNGNASMFNENELSISSLRSGGVKGMSGLSDANVVNILSYPANVKKGKVILLTDKGCIRIFDIANANITKRLGKPLTTVFRVFKSEPHKLIYASKVESKESPTLLRVMDNLSTVREIQISDYSLTPLDKYAKQNYDLKSKEYLSLVFVEGHDFIKKDEKSEYVPVVNNPSTEESSSDIDKGLDDEKGYHQISIFDDDPSFDE